VSRHKRLSQWIKKEAALLLIKWVAWLVSFKIKYVDLTKGSVFQDAREVKTKFSKTFTTYFFPVG